MGVAVLSPENCLRDDFSHQRRPLISPPRSKPRRSPAVNIAIPDQARSGRRRRQRSPAGSPPPSSPPRPKSGGDGKTYRAKSPVVTGQVRILKRGEDLTPAKLQAPATTPAKLQAPATTPAKLQAPTTTPVRDRKASREPVPAPILSVFAGSVSFTSPPPSSVPLPLFCKKQVGAGAGGLSKCSAEAAAVDLRRMLRLG